MQPQPKILVISFFFPPYNKVGGRRWAKHCKYFVRENIDFYVLAGGFTGSSAWDKDLDAYRERIERVEIKKKYSPYHLRKLPGNIAEKIYWKLSLLRWELIKNRLKGNYRDVSAGNEKAFYERAQALIKNKNINTVIISVGPFAYSAILPGLKTEFPQVNFIIDYRDYWEDDFTGLTASQVAYENKLQEKVLQAAAMVLSPNAEMARHYSSKANRSYLLPHCIDTDDLLNLPEKSGPGRNITLLYGGAFYTGIGPNLETIKSCIDELNKFQGTRADFYVSIQGYEKELAHEKISRHGFINTRDYFEKVKQSDAVILILPADRVNAMSSKFYELVALQRPILYFGGKGDVSDFIIKHRLGFHITKENVTRQVTAILNNLISQDIPDRHYDISTHTFEYQTRLLLEEIKQL